MKDFRHEKRNITMKKVVTLILLVLWMSVIFFFSAQNGTQSSGISRFIGYGIAENKNRLLQKDESKEELTKQVEAMQFVIRKGAHMAEYALLAIFFSLHLCTYKKRPGKFWIWAWAFSTLFAATDEFHQWFVPGRDGRFLDVCIDSVGSLIGILVFMLCYHRLGKRKQVLAEKPDLQ